MEADPFSFDAIFKEAVTAIDQGDEVRLRQLLDAYPDLVTQRLTEPGEWLTSVIGNDLQGFFKDPYLLWFVAEDAVRNKTLPPNITAIADIIIRKLKTEKAESLQKQLDYTLTLVAWSWVARECGVQIALLDKLLDAGADPAGAPNNALVNGHSAAAAHLLNRGAPLTLASALHFGRWAEADELVKAAEQEEKQFSLTLSALNGRAQAVQRMIGYGADINRPARDLYSHGTPLHHAVWSGSLETVQLLIEAGARTDIQDTAYGGTPLGWADYGDRKVIGDYLRGLGAG